MTAAMDSASQWLAATRRRWLAWAGIACYIIATPFLALSVWSAGQVWLGGVAHLADDRFVRSIALVALARHHLIPVALFGLVSLAIAYLGGLLLHRSTDNVPSSN